jgi:photoactive yellow protein
MDVIPFGSKDIDNILQREPQRVELLAFGGILLDRQGKILQYNQAEGFIAGRSPSDVIGKDFFNQIAPCAKGKRFHGEFLKFVKTGSVHSLLEYEFDYKMKRTQVRIHLKSNSDGKTCWLFIKRV